MTLPELWIDAAFRGPPGAHVLVGPSSRFAVAMAGLAERGDQHDIPDRIVLDLYGYEIVERMRERDTARDSAWIVPFWPRALHDAAHGDANAADELMGMWPERLAIHYRAASRATVAAAARAIFGAVRFDPDEYGPCASAALLDATGVTHVADAALVRAGAILLERRRDDARCYAGCWDTPGGHIEAGESAAAAIARELAEELGIAVTAATPASIVDDLDPTSGRVYRHHGFAIDEWSGEPMPHDGQTLAWHAIDALPGLPALNPMVLRLVADGFASR